MTSLKSTTMKKYKITARAVFEVVTIVEAESEELALSTIEKEGENRGVIVCMHGSESMIGANEDEFVLTDGVYEELYDYEVTEEIDDYD